MSSSRVGEHCDNCVSFVKRFGFLSTSSVKFGTDLPVSKLSNNCRHSGDDAHRDWVYTASCFRSEYKTPRSSAPYIRTAVNLSRVVIWRELHSCLLMSWIKGSPPTSKPDTPLRFIPRGASAFTNRRIFGARRRSSAAALRSKMLRYRHGTPSFWPRQLQQTKSSENTRGKVPMPAFSSPHRIRRRDEDAWIEAGNRPPIWVFTSPSFYDLTWLLRKPVG